MSDPQRSIIPWLFVGFFGVVIASNGFMAWLAVSTFTGLDTTKAYAKGLNYNETLAKVRAQEALGWQAAVRIEGVRERLDLALDLKDDAGRPLRRLDAKVQLVRPANVTLDRTLVLTEVSPGRYVAPLDDAALGLWEVRGRVARDDDVFYLTERIVLR